MFKLVVLSALLAVAAARPGYLESGPLLYSAPATIVHEPAYAKIGAIVKSIPTAVSHQSQSIVHSSAQYVQPIVAPIIKTTYTSPYIQHAGPILKTYSPLLAPQISYSSGWSPAWH